MTKARAEKLVDAIQEICTSSLVVRKITMDGKVIFKDDNL